MTMSDFVTSFEARLGDLNSSNYCELIRYTNPRSFEFKSLFTKAVSNLTKCLISDLGIWYKHKSTLAEGELISDVTHSFNEGKLFEAMLKLDEIALVLKRGEAATRVLLEPHLLLLLRIERFANDLLVILENAALSPVPLLAERLFTCHHYNVAGMNSLQRKQLENGRIMADKFWRGDITSTSVQNYLDTLSNCVLKPKPNNEPDELNTVERLRLENLLDQEQMTLDFYEMFAKA